MKDDKRLTFTISAQAHRALRFLAADQGVSQQVVIERLLLEAGARWLEPETEKRRGKAAEANSPDL